MRNKMLFLFLLSSLQTAAQLLESLDSNKTGNDDRVAKILRVAVVALEEFIKEENRIEVARLTRGVSE